LTGQARRRAVTTEMDSDLSIMFPQKVLLLSKRWTIWQSLKPSPILSPSFSPFFGQDLQD
jgi:hypothetical protein